jgi:hypothetical protein
MKDDFDFIKEKFTENFKIYKKHFTHFEKINNYETKWSYSYIDFYPYDSTMSGYNPPKLYNNNPVLDKDKTIIQNRFLNNEIYYAFNYFHKEWGSEFFFTDEKNNKIRLFYENQNDEEKILLSQLEYKIMENDIVDKVYSYMYDPDMEEETFYVFKYFYNFGKIAKIIRSDYFNIFPEIIFDESNKFNLIRPRK